MIIIEVYNQRECLSCKITITCFHFQVGDHTGTQTIGYFEFNCFTAETIWIGTRDTSTDADHYNIVIAAVPWEVFDQDRSCCQVECVVNHTIRPNNESAVSRVVCIEIEQNLVCAVSGAFPGFNRYMGYFTKGIKR